VNGILGDVNKENGATTDAAATTTTTTTTRLPTANGP
jgi:hypothetical protein